MHFNERNGGVWNQAINRESIMRAGHFPYSVITEYDCGVYNKVFKLYPGKYHWLNEYTKGPIVILREGKGSPKLLQGTKFAFFRMCL